MHSLEKSFNLVDKRFFGTVQAKKCGILMVHYPASKALQPNAGYSHFKMNINFNVLSLFFSTAISQNSIFNFAGLGFQRPFFLSKPTYCLKNIQKVIWHFLPNVLFFIWVKVACGSMHIVYTPFCEIIVSQQLEWNDNATFGFQPRYKLHTASFYKQPVDFTR